MEEISYASPQESKKSRLSKRLFVFGGLFVVILILLGSAIYFITRDTSPQEDEITKSIVLPEDEELTPTPAEEELAEAEEVEEDEEPTPTPIEEVEEEITVSVQNGSGVQGAAGEATNILRDAGFTISQTTNADDTNYTDVTIQIKNSRKNNLKAIEDALSEEYVIGSTSADLPESSRVDVVVIIGA